MVLNDQRLSGKYKILGENHGEHKEVEFLGRKIRLTNEGLEYEAGEKHVQALLQEWSLDGCREVSTPGVGSERKDLKTQDQALGKEEAARYRRGAAICNYLSLDRCDIAYSTKEVSRGMACPTETDEVR